MSGTMWKEAGRPKRSSSGRWAVNGLKADWQVERSPDGWLTVRSPFSEAGGQNLLALHGDWAGPVKLVERQGRVERRVEFCLGQPGAADEDTLDEEAAREAEELQVDLLKLVVRLDAGAKGNDWQPPPAEALAGWLAQCGRETAIDQQQNLRLTLKRRGCDGQARIERGEGRLRLVLPLGQWPELDPVAHDAMRLLAGSANSRSRLVRIAWLTEGSGRRCEAQVDLSGLPTGTEPNGARERLWQETLTLAVSGLELALRQLGVELLVLAEPRNRELAALVLAQVNP